MLRNSGSASVVSLMSILAHPPDPHKFKMGWGVGGRKEVEWGGGGEWGGGDERRGKRKSPSTAASSCSEDETH